MTGKSLVFFIATALASVGAQAALGEKVQATDKPQQATGTAALAAGAARSEPGFTRRELTLDDGTKATEFVNDDGMVFAVTWASSTMPDLRAILGAYMTGLEKQQQARFGKARSPGRLQVTEGDWTIVSVGHLRAYKGYSYLGSLLPHSFDTRRLAQ